MDELEQLKGNFLRSLKAAEEQSGLDLSWLKVQYMQLYEAAQKGVQADGGEALAKRVLDEIEYVEQSIQNIPEDSESITRELMIAYIKLIKRVVKYPTAAKA